MYKNNNIKILYFRSIRCEEVLDSLIHAAYLWHSCLSSLEMAATEHGAGAPGLGVPHTGHQQHLVQKHPTLGLNRTRRQVASIKEPEICTKYMLFPFS